MPSSDIHISTGDTDLLGAIASPRKAALREGVVLAETAAIRLRASWPWTEKQLRTRNGKRKPKRDPQTTISIAPG
jgi:hypothetical protein